MIYQMENLNVTHITFCSCACIQIPCKRENKTGNELNYTAELLEHWENMRKGSSQIYF